MALYMPFDNSIYQLKLPPLRSDGLSPLSQQKILVYIGNPLKGEKCTDSALFDRSANIEDALRQVSYLMSDCLHSRILNCKLYYEGDEWSELSQYVLENSWLPQVFQILPDSVVGVFKATGLSSPRGNVIYWEENVVPVI